MLSYQIYNLLKDIIRNTYSEEDYPDNKFEKFFIDVRPKEMKTVHGRYYIKTKKIEIFNLSRPTEHVVTTAIHEVAHHIDCCLRNSSDHTKEFYEIMYKLLISALGMEIITIENILSESDSADKNRLIKYFGLIEEWEVPNIIYKKEKVVIKVNNCFNIKDDLRKKGYKFSGIEKIWTKELDQEELEEEKEWLNKLIDMDNVEISEGNKINIAAVYYLVISNSYDHKDHLKELGYIWKGYNIKGNSWNKKILANDKEEELSKIENLSGVKIKIISK